MKVLKVLVLIILWISCFVFFNSDHQIINEKLDLSLIEEIKKPKFRSSFSPKNKDDAQARSEYEHVRLRDPKTKLIPRNIRNKEIKFVNRLSQKGDLNKNSQNLALTSTWTARGPINVGGRTRALAIDLDFNGSSNQKILAGGVSGGIFMSLDNGNSWQRTTSNSSLPSVTCIAQDPNNKNVWYYGSGELLGNSAGGDYLGQGIFKSTDGGSSWTQLESTYQGTSLSTFDNLFDIVWNASVHPTSSDVYAATIGGVHRSTDGGDSWTRILTGQDDQNFLSQMTDVIISTDGDIFATLSRNGANLSQGNFGVFRSTDGSQFTNISPSGLTPDPYRMVLGSAPSNSDILYVLVQVNAKGETAQDHQLFRYDKSTNTWEDLSSNIPDEQGVPGNASFSSQGGYDLIVKVKPDNPNVVWIGGTNLYRSTDGGQSFVRVGGYKEPSNYSQFQDSHSDMHSISFYPNNPDAMINGNDGGLSQSMNVLQSLPTWKFLNNGYLTTQFYSVAIDPQSGNDNLIIGGLQDNGSWAVESTNFSTPWVSMLSGDGGYTAISPGGNNQYVSVQNGPVFRYTFQNNQWLFSQVGPVAQNFLFIPPYQLDPNNENVMYMAAGNAVWRNSDLSGIPQGNQDATSTNWTELTNSAVPNTQVTVLSVSKQPANRLYFGATDYQAISKIYRVDNAQNNSQGTDITPPGITAGSFPSSIGINPNNADEIIIAFSNYNIPSIWYSSNGGNTWTDIEGNLSGQEGPSIRWAIISPTGGYFLATSTGVFSTSSLDGSNTSWVQEATDVIGNVVVNMLAFRPEDGFLVAGTHGRGVYSTKLGSTGSSVAAVNVNTLTLQARPGETGSTSFILSNNGNANLNFNISVTGNFGSNLSKVFDKTKVLTKPTKEIQKYIIQRNEKRRNTFSDNSVDLTKGNGDNLKDDQYKINGNDILFLDDGDASSDDFFGYSNGSDLYFYNEFDVSGFNFQMEAVQFYLRTEQAATNLVEVGIYDAGNNLLSYGDLSFAVSPNGSWYEVTLNPALAFNNGEVFYIEILSKSGISFPAGIDSDAQIKNKSFYFDYDANDYRNLSTLSGFENSCFLIRARGAKESGGGGNQNPTAVASVSKSQANVNEQISFDASQSSDSDGQIVQYLWNFGDGETSSSQSTTHAYTQANTYNYTLTVTDNQGAMGQTNGQIIVGTSSSEDVTVTPSSGTILPGSSENITLSLNAQNISQGSYVGQVDIVTNGGNIAIPIDYLVDVEQVSVLPSEYSLSQNYPNPFNPSTNIEFSLPEKSNVSLIIYDMLGKEVKVLVDDSKAAGKYRLHYEDSNLASGIYIYRLTSEKFTQAKKMIFIK